MSTQQPAPPAPGTPRAPPGDGPPGGQPPEGSPAGSRSAAFISAITEGNPFVVTVLAIVAAVFLGGLLIAFSDTPVLHAWSQFFSSPGAAISQSWDAAAAAYSALIKGSIINPHTVS